MADREVKGPQNQAAPGGRSAGAGPGADSRTAAGSRDQAPAKPSELGRGAWGAAARRVISEYRNDILQDRAAALTYYSVLSIFPALLVLVSLLGLIGKSATQPVLTSLTSAAPQAVRHIVETSVQHLQRGHATAGVAAIIGIAVGLNSASSYIAAFMRASNAIYDVPEGRPVWKTLPIRLGVTLVLLVLLIAALFMVVVTGGLAHRVGQVLGIGPTAVTVWNIAKWPVLVLVVSLMLAILYWASPNARQGFRWFSPGGVVAVVIWLIASGLFALYVANFGNYNKVYGSIAAVIIFLIWMWVTNMAVLIGAEFNAELQRGRAIAAGLPPDQEPFVKLRDTRKLRKHAKQA